MVEHIECRLEQRILLDEEEIQVPCATAGRGRVVAHWEEESNSGSLQVHSVPGGCAPIRKSAGGLSTRGIVAEDPDQTSGIKEH